MAKHWKKSYKRNSIAIPRAYGNGNCKKVALNTSFTNKKWGCEGIKETEH